jgi:hypothetical protein
VAGGELTLIPGLFQDIESEWRYHQAMVDRILSHHRMYEWKIRFTPRRQPARNKGRGLIAREIKLIVIESHNKHEMVATLYHEILHFEHRGWTEAQIEAETQNVFPLEVFKLTE